MAYYDDFCRKSTHDSKNCWRLLHKPHGQANRYPSSLAGRCQHMVYKLCAIVDLATSRARRYSPAFLAATLAVVDIYQKRGIFSAFDPLILSDALGVLVWPRCVFFACQHVFDLRYVLYKLPTHATSNTLNQPSGLRCPFHSFEYE